MENVCRTEAPKEASQIAPLPPALYFVRRLFWNSTPMARNGAMFVKNPTSKFAPNSLFGTCRWKVRALAFFFRGPSLGSPLLRLIGNRRSVRGRPFGISFRRRIAFTMRRRVFGVMLLGGTRIAIRFRPNLCVDFLSKNRSFLLTPTLVMRRSRSWKRRTFGRTVRRIPFRGLRLVLLLFRGRTFV